ARPRSVIHCEMLLMGDMAGSCSTRPAYRALGAMCQSGPRMGLLVRGPQAGGADVGVDLRGDETLVAQQLLHAADVGAAVEQMRCKTVSERVRRGSQVEA